MRRNPNNPTFSYRNTKPTGVIPMGLFAVNQTAEGRCETYFHYTRLAKKGGE